jgi:hypothetical protein
MLTRFAGLLALAGAAAVALAGCGGSNSSDHFAMMQYGPGMMGYGPLGTGAQVRTLDQARRQAHGFADGLGLDVGELTSFTRNYYVELVDDTGAPATEVLVSPSNGAVWLEYGPAMMWNTEYGMLGGRGGMMGGGMMGGGMMGGGMMGGGMMGGGPYGDPSYGLPGAPTGAEDVSPDGARRIADRWLKARGTGLHAGEAERFPGYYTLHTLRGDRVTGMLSVNAHTGAVWYHWWHGRFRAMEG